MKLTKGNSLAVLAPELAGFYHEKTTLPRSSLQEWQSLVSALEAAGVEVLTAEAQGLPDPRHGVTWEW